MRIKRKSFEANIPSMAMGDIAFLLLIFFVILARVNDDSHIRWTPTRVQDLQPGEMALARVAIDADNRTYLNGKETSASQLAPQIASLLGDSPAGQRIVTVKVHREVPAMYFEPAMEAIAEAGGDMFHILEQQEDQR